MMEQKHIQRQQQSKLKSLEYQNRKAKMAGSGNLWSNVVTKPQSPRLLSKDRMQVKQYARQKNQFLKREDRSSTNLKASYGNTSSHSRVGLYNTVNHDSQNPCDISALFKPFNLNHSMQRAQSGLRSTKKISTDQLLGNRSQFLLSQNVTMSGFDGAPNRDLQQTSVNQASQGMTHHNLASD